MDIMEQLRLVIEVYAHARETHFWEEDQGGQHSDYPGAVRALHTAEQALNGTLQIVEAALNHQRVMGTTLNG